MTSGEPGGYLIDLDGTLYAGGKAIPGAIDALRRLRARGIPFRLVTNTTSRSRAMLMTRLESYGFEVAPQELFTATLAGAELARARGHRSIAPFLPAGALEDLEGFRLVGGSSGRPNPAGDRPEAVLVGDLGERWTFGLMQEAFEYLMAGASLIALSRDRYWLREDRLTLDAGAFVAGLEYAIGRTAEVAGKPSRAFFEAALASLGGIESSRVAMVGDDLWSDVQGAQRAGLQGWLVRTGKFRPEALAAGPDAPDRVLESVAQLDRG